MCGQGSTRAEMMCPCAYGGLAVICLGLSFLRMLSLSVWVWGGALLADLTPCQLPLSLLSNPVRGPWTVDHGETNAG